MDGRTQPGPNRGAGCTQPGACAVRTAPHGLPHSYTDLLHDVGNEEALSAKRLADRSHTGKRLLMEPARPASSCFGTMKGCTAEFRGNELDDPSLELFPDGLEVRFGEDRVQLRL